MRFLITGSAGQLAQEYISRFERDGTEYFAPPESDLDITDEATVRDCLASVKPDVVLNCAAYNNVDGAETDLAAAMQVNSEAVGNLARPCREANALLVHYSTDYVFDGNKDGLYVETDATGPINRYGESKLAGEQCLADETEDYLVFRLSWLFGGSAGNLLSRLLEWSRETDVLRVVWDQVSVPTYTVDVADVSLRAVEAGTRGLYHLTNTGYASKYEVARFLFSEMGLSALVLPVSSDVFSSPAKRPFFSAMSNDNLSAELGTDIPTWENAVERFVESRSIA